MLTWWRRYSEVDGREGNLHEGLLVSSAEVRSPQIALRQGLMLGSSTAKTRSHSRRMDVWSKVSLHTQPPRLYGETMTVGTRNPSPMGRPPTNSSLVPGGGAGGGTWSKKPPFSS